MRVYQVGPDAVNESELAGNGKFKWIVYWYQSGYYDGEGEAVALSTDNVLYCKGLSHCSCYGPEDGGMLSGDTIPIETFLADKDDIMTYDARKEIKDKVRSIVTRAAKRANQAKL